MQPFSVPSIVCASIFKIFYFPVSLTDTLVIIWCLKLFWRNNLDVNRNSKLFQKLIPKIHKWWQLLKICNLSVARIWEFVCEYKHYLDESVWISVVYKIAINNQLVTCHTVSCSWISFNFQYIDFSEKLKTYISLSFDQIYLLVNLACSRNKND